MKIKLIEDIPVEKKHGMTKGRILEVQMAFSTQNAFRVRGDDGQDVKIWAHECEVMKND